MKKQKNKPLWKNVWFYFILFFMLLNISTGTLSIQVALVIAVILLGIRHMLRLNKRNEELISKDD